MKIEKLTAAQEGHLAATYKEWLSIGRMSKPLDREAATKCIGDMYEAIVEKRPAVLFFSSPIMCVLAYGVLKNSQLGGQLQLRDQLRGQLNNHFGGNQWSAWEVFY